MLRDNNGRTPLSMAAQKKHESIVRLLAQAKDTAPSPATPEEDGRPSISISITRFDFRHAVDQSDVELESPFAKRHSLSLPSARKSPKFDTRPICQHSRLFNKQQSEENSNQHDLA